VEMGVELTAFFVRTARSGGPVELGGARHGWFSDDVEA